VDDNNNDNNALCFGDRALFQWFNGFGSTFQGAA